MKSVFFILFAMLFSIGLFAQDDWKKEIQAIKVDQPDNQRKSDDNFIVDTLLKMGKPAKIIESGAFVVIENEGAGTTIVDSQNVVIYLVGTKIGEEPSAGRRLTIDLSKDKFMREIVSGLKLGAKIKILCSVTVIGGPAKSSKISPPEESVLVLDLVLESIFDEEKLIQDYIAKNGLEMKQTASGLYYSIKKESNGPHPNVEDEVTVHYEGWLLDGTVFDSSYKREAPASFPLSGVIKGWQEALPLLGIGEEGLFIIPYNLAYGERGISRGGIPGYSTLIFKVELIDIK